MKDKRAGYKSTLANSAPLVDLHLTEVKSKDGNQHLAFAATLPVVTLKHLGRTGQFQLTSHQVLISLN